MTQEFSGDVDLFGDPVYRSNGKRGRPAHEWTIRNSNKVKMLLAVGWSNQRIANSIYVSLPTLRKHYFSELKVRDIMRDRMVARQFELVLEAAESGNVAAMKELRSMIEKEDLVLADAVFDREVQTPAPEILGKKEQAAREAENAGQGSDWGSDLLPMGKPN